MKLFVTPASPWTRRCIVSIMELGIEDKVERIQTIWPHSWATRTIPSTAAFAAATPVQRIPALVLDDDLRLCDSFAICDYLDAEYGNNRLLPKPGKQRWRLQSIISIAGGLLEAQILRRGELLRKDGERSDDFLQKMCEREARCYDALEETMDWFEADFDLAQITLGVICSYADFRFPKEDWRTGRPNITRWFETFVQRPSMQATMPRETPQQ
jgi:glutathione S-transferase